MKRAFGMLLAGCVLLAGCGSDEEADSAGAGAGGPLTSADLCVNSSCGERVVLLDIPGAENQIFTDDGRLFISSGSGVYEIHKSAAGEFSAALLSDACGFTGLAIKGDVLYAVCGSSELYAARLTATPAFEQIFTFDGMCIPNGTSLGPDGNLYVVDEPLNVCVPDPKIVRLKIDPANPMHILSQETWVKGSAAGLLAVGVGNVLRFPNGLVREGNRFYGTDGGSVYHVDLMPDGNAGEVTPLFFEVTAHDDLGLAGSDALVVCDFLLGRIALLSRTGELLQATDYGLFSFPSSARMGRPPMFAPDEVVVTETGVLVDQSLPLDHLSVFRRKR